MDRAQWTRLSFPLEETSPSGQRVRSICNYLGTFGLSLSVFIDQPLPLFLSIFAHALAYPEYTPKLAMDEP